MGNKIAVTDNGVHKIGKKLFLTDENLVHCKVKKGFITQNGVHRLVYSSGAKWKKYSCYQDEVPTSYIRVSSTDEWSIGDTEVGHYYSLHYDDGYSFSSSDGFISTGSGEAESMEEIPSVCYRVSDEMVWKMISCTPIEDPSYSAFVEVTWECVDLCVGDETEMVYMQGDTFYGTIEVEDGELPEEGELLDGSPTELYCVLFCADGYEYFYVRGD